MLPMKWPLDDFHPEAVSQPSLPNLLRQITSIGGIGIVCHMGGFIRAEPDHQFGNLLGLSQPPDGMSCGQSLGSTGISGNTFVQTPPSSSF